MIIPNYFASKAHPISITLVGLGGTGSALLMHLARIHISLKAKGLQGLMVTCIDDDTVTPANMGRQLFTENDMGRHKAVVLTERINRFYGTSWDAIADKFSMRLINAEPLPGNIFISCVDNVSARKKINTYLFNAFQANYRETIENHFWIDTGNTKDKGQVICGSFAHKLKTVVDIFPDMDKHQTRDKTPSCSLAEALEKQDLFINTTVAQVTAQLVWDICTKPVIDWAGAFININAQKPIVKIRA